MKIPCNMSTSSSSEYIYEESMFFSCSEANKRIFNRKVLPAVLDCHWKLLSLKTNTSIEKVE